MIEFYYIKGTVRQSQKPETCPAADDRGILSSNDASHQKMEVKK